MGINFALFDQPVLQKLVLVACNCKQVKFLPFWLQVKPKSASPSAAMQNVYLSFQRHGTC